MCVSACLCVSLCACVWCVPVGVCLVCVHVWSREESQLTPEREVLLGGGDVEGRERPHISLSSLAQPRCTHVPPVAPALSSRPPESHPLQAAQLLGPGTSVSHPLLVPGMVAASCCGELWAAPVGISALPLPTDDSLH